MNHFSQQLNMSHISQCKPLANLRSRLFEGQPNRASSDAPLGGLLKEYPEALWHPTAPPERWPHKEIADGLETRLAPDRVVRTSSNITLGELLREFPEALWQPTAPPERWSPKEISDGLKTCLKALASIEADVEPLPPIREGACGIAAPVKLRSLGGEEKVTFKPPVTINCPMVVAMERWLDGVQPAARSAFGSPVAQIVGSSYACRNVYNRDQARLSQHAFGNAFDLPSFVLASGRRVHVVLGWGSTARDQRPMLVPVVAKPEPQMDRAEDEENQPAQKRTDTAEAKFLRRVHKEACAHFSTVLGPEVDSVHRDHFHLDLQTRGPRDVCR